MSANRLASHGHIELRPGVFPVVVEDRHQGEHRMGFSERRVDLERLFRFGIHQLSRFRRRDLILAGHHEVEQSQLTMSQGELRIALDGLQIALFGAG